MSNTGEFYTNSGYPSQGAAGSSASMRAELSSIVTGFNKLPSLTLNNNKHIKVSTDGTNLEHSNVISDDGTNATIAGNTIFSNGTIGANGINRHTIPATTSDTLVLRTATQTLTNKTISAANNTITTAASGNLTSTNLNAALAELQSDIDTRLSGTALSDHTGESSGAHAASAISNAPSGNLSALNVQSALNELQGDINIINTSIGTLASELDIVESSIFRKNLIVNPEFFINNGVLGTPYVSGAVLASGAYGHEMWKAGTSGGDYTFTSSILSPNTLTIATGKTLIQNIEPPAVLTTSYILSWTGTAQARVGVNSSTPSGSYASSPILITGQTIGSALSIEFNSGTLNMPTLNEGSVVQVNSLRSFEDVLFETQRYAYKHDRAEGTYAEGVTSAVDTLFLIAHLVFPKKMRAIPTSVGFATMSLTRTSLLDFHATSEYGAYLRYSVSNGSTGFRAVGQLATGFFFFNARI